jgi:hypothetical protein
MTGHSASAATEGFAVLRKPFKMAALTTALQDSMRGKAR